jgi:3-isopropylmalate/(R)-2-methylmalate dehydratase small subunit
VNPVTLVTGTAYPWGAKNVDTDVIIPARWLKTITRAGLGRGAFETVRAEPGNVFDDPRYAGAAILIAGDNFGCGSSREHAAWALADMGVAAVIAPSFSDIFSGNAVKNGIVPVVLPQAAVDRLLAAAIEAPVTVDLETMTVTTPFQDRFVFALDPFRRRCLMEGLDEIGLTLARDTEISNFEGEVRLGRPWIEGRSRYEGSVVEGAGRT